MNILISMIDIYLFMPELFIIFSFFILLIYGVSISTNKNYGYPVLLRSIGYLTIIVFLFTLFFLIKSSDFSSVYFSNFFFSNQSLKWIKITLLIISIFYIFLIVSNIHLEKLNIFEFFLLFLLTILAIFLIISTFDLISIYISLEILNLTFYVLATIKRTSEFSTEAGLKYFILGVFSTGILLFGISLIYGYTGITNFTDLNIFIQNLIENKNVIEFPIQLLLGLVLISVSFFFKLSAAPFHMWSPDVYEGTITSVIALFTIFTKVIIFYLFINLFNFAFYDLFSIWQKLVIFCAFFSLFLGTFIAFIQTKFKRFLAYSSINHMGFIIMAVSSANCNGFYSLFFYIIIYILINLGIFSSFSSLRSVTSYKVNQQARYINEFIILSKTQPMVAFSMLIIFFSIAGIPPLAGFFAKLIVFLTCLENSFYSLVIFSILISCLAAFYYIRIIKIIYFDNFEIWPIYLPIDRLKANVLSFSVLSLTLFCLNPNLIINIIYIIVIM
uniref:NADH dehydrogenase subunit 2 n=1 Tax=Cyanidiococcus yangmingshanensis TaxID=2690220 RepID=A0A7G5VUB5_9RHOD|nr:NADH dehydrogenase subunit 2 [Cyanidiococcus yangmingshanensis]QMX77282.1 NADH dehydrogenase subunit 2 [Cyanidiococcus yangmingshanensis]